MRLTVLLRRKRKLKAMFLMSTSMILFACTTPQPAQTPVELAPSGPTVDIQQAIVQTADSAQTLTATSLPSPTTTFTPSPSPTSPTPTQTFFFSIPTLTPVWLLSDGENVLDLSSPEPIPFTGKPWTCIGRGRYPSSGGIIPAGEAFIATWTVINTGTKNWSVNAIDLIHVSGYLPEGNRIQDLYKSVRSGQSVTWFVNYIAPKKPGVYSSAWQVMVARDRMCGVTFTFEVPEKKK